MPVAVQAKLADDRAARVAFILATSAEWGAMERALRDDINLEAATVLVRGTRRSTRPLRGLPPRRHRALLPNDLRRTFSHWMSDQGVPNEVIAPMMGHADTRMLSRVYNRKTPEELARAVRRAAGLPEPAAPQAQPASQGQAGAA